MDGDERGMVNMVYPILGSQTVLPFYLTGIGISEPEYHVIRENGLVSHQLLYTADGTGELKAGGRTYTQRKGSLFYLPPALPHEYYPKDSAWTTCWVVFRGNYADKLLADLGFDSLKHTSDADMTRLEAVFKRLLALADDPMENERVSALVYEYILLAREQFFVPTRGRSSEGSIIRRALDHIDSNYMRDITLPELAEMSGVSPQHFCRVFKAKLGARPLEYIAKRRIAQAKLLLITTDLPINEIARRVGYSDQTYFGVVFKRAEGVSPGEFRRTSVIYPV